MKLGDKVKVISHENKKLIGLKGVIVEIDNLNPPIGVDLNITSLGLLHDLQGVLKNKSGFYFTKEELEVIESAKQGVPETLTLLDQFAMSALQGVLANSRMIHNAGDESIAKACYDLAKQMIETRKEYL